MLTCSAGVMLICSGFGLRSCIFVRSDIVRFQDSSFVLANSTEVSKKRIETLFLIETLFRLVALFFQIKIIYLKSFFSPDQLDSVYVLPIFNLTSQTFQFGAQFCFSRVCRCDKCTTCTDVFFVYLYGIVLSVQVAGTLFATSSLRACWVACW